jgi:hypothetical protein
MSKANNICARERSEQARRQNKSRRKFKKQHGINKWIADNKLTQLVADNNRKEWLDKDDRFVLVSGLSVIKKAVLLGRTKNAVEHRIKYLNSK